MGGWLMALVALARPHRVQGLVGVAAAADFTEDLLRGRLDSKAKEALETAGVVRVPNSYGEEPIPITRQLIDDGRNHLILRGRIPLSCPVRLLHGMADAHVPWQLSVRLAETLESPDVVLTLVKAGDHRMSDPPNLTRLLRAIEEVRRSASRHPDEAT
jgi:pimeloyl-ACP methyl ester carboxylesterase